MKIDELESEIQELINRGYEISKYFSTEDKTNLFLEYEAWYSKALLYVKRLNIDRLKDFEQLYKLEKRKGIDNSTYTISDALNDTVVDYYNVHIGPENAYFKMIQQIMILKGTKEVLNSKIYNLQELLQADIFDNELSSAKELNKKGFYRAAGAICGVVLEEHFSKVLSSHAINIQKKVPTINDYNELLKNNSIIDIPTFRHIQLLGDIRNLCDHKKTQEPTQSQIQDLINGTEKIIKTVF